MLLLLLYHVFVISKNSKESCSQKITNKKSNKTITMYCSKTEDYVQSRHKIDKRWGDYSCAKYLLYEEPRFGKTPEVDVSISI